MATVEQIQQWCEEARKLLKIGKGKFSDSVNKELKKFIDSIATKLQKLTVDTSLSLAYIPLQTRFEELAKKMQATANEVSSDRGKDKEKKKSEQAKLKTEFEILEKDIVDTLPVKKKKEAYAKAYELAKNEIDLLEVTPHVLLHQELKQRLLNIHSQTEQVTVTAFEIGINKLEGLQTDIKKEKEDATKRRKAALEQSEKQPECVQELESARNLLSEIEKLDGVGAHAKKHRDVIQAAENLASSGQYKDALTKLKELKNLTTLSNIKDESERQVRTLNEIKGYEQGKSDLQALEALMPADALRTLRNEFKRTSNALIDGNIKSETQEAFNAVLKNIKEALQTRQSQNNELDQLGKDLTNMYDSLAEIASPFSLLEDKLAFDTFKTWCASKLIPEAWEKGKQLEISLGTKLDAISKEHEAWEFAKVEQPTIFQGLTELGNSACKAIDMRSRTLARTIDTPEINRLEEMREWALLTKQFEQAKKILAEFKLLNDGYGELAMPRQQAHAQVEEKRKALIPLIQQFDKAVLDQCEQDGLPALDAGKRYMLLIDRVMKDWEGSMSTITDLKSLNISQELALKELATIENSLEQANLPEGINKAVGEHGQNLTQPEFEKAWLEFERLQLQSQTLDNTTAKQLAKKGMEVRKLAPPDWKAALAALNELNKKAVGDIEIAGNAQAGLRQTILNLGQDVLNEINKSKQSTQNAKKFEGAFKVLMDEHAELMLLGKSNNIDALKEAEQGLMDLRVRATKLTGAQDGQGVSLDKVIVLVEQAKKDMQEATAHLKENDPQALVKLTESWLLLEPEIYSLEPDVSTEKLNEFMGRIVNAKAGADKVVLVRNEFNEKLPKAKELLAEVKKSNVAPQYTKQLEARLNEAQKKGGVPGTVVQALTSLKALIQDIFDARTNPELARLKEKGVLQAQEQDKVTLKTYEQTLKICEDKYIKDAKAAVSNSHGDEALPLELTRMLDMAKQTFKQGNVDEALKQVKLTIERAKQIVANPYGPTIGSRNNLPEDKKVWVAAIEAFGQSLKEVRLKSLESVGEIHDDAKQALTGMLLDFEKRFDPMAFDACLFEVTDPKADTGKRRAAREKALALVNSNRAILSKHPYVKKLMSNPEAKTEFSLAYRRMQSALSRLEANISRCVR